MLKTFTWYRKISKYGNNKPLNEYVYFIKIIQEDGYDFANGFQLHVSVNKELFFVSDYSLNALPKFCQEGKPDIDKSLLQHKMIDSIFTGSCEF